MIIKYMNSAGKWTWISKIDVVHEIGFVVDPSTLETSIHSPHEIEYVGDETGIPYVLSVAGDDGPRLLGIRAKEAYLVEDSTGNTIDVLIKPKSR